MKLRTLSIAGAYEVTPVLRGDPRGLFCEWIRADLERQSVPAGAAEEALAAIPVERERVQEQAAGLGGGASAARSLRRRGFSEDAVEAVLARAVAEGS